MGTSRATRPGRAESTTGRVPGKIHATPIPTRIAVKIFSIAEGSTTLRKICALLAPSVRATSMHRGGVLFTPDIAPMMMTGRVPTRIRMALGHSPMPNQRTPRSRWWGIRRRLAVPGGYRLTKTRAASARRALSLSPGLRRLVPAPPRRRADS
ncbi:hypothetical protein NECAME_18502 [Necator americanus]|uniref:Uncharacterized protein n=1 Tax=Necator americanus TaxID=51031 RepID=W2STR6_NECAM|nr:hypothetical protein NECAME_18502 [Necator americanus]ETN73144.1 hypothetical protein NECAME_18502 [Necator americanus]